MRPRAHWAVCSCSTASNGRFAYLGWSDPLPAETRTLLPLVLPLVGIASVIFLPISFIILMWLFLIFQNIVKVIYDKASALLECITGENLWKFEDRERYLILFYAFHRYFLERSYTYFVTWSCWVVWCCHDDKLSIDLLSGSNSLAEMTTTCPSHAQA